MRVLCPTCHGKGSISDPKCSEQMMCYCGPNGESFPQVFCQTCGGSGWVDSPQIPFPDLKENIIVK